ncbi:MAG TPA: hypothetical protein VN661_08220 [Candidatus Acidoferrales bacterium]|nr:hypothetical protein [Candidatus Acidoferrales bacterium]
MRHKPYSIAAIFLLAVAALICTGLAASRASAAPPERYIHVRVNNGNPSESVNVNVPLSIAETILPAVNRGPLHNGIVSVPAHQLNGVDVRAILDALRAAPDNNFVTVKSKSQNVRVAKSNGNIVVHVSSTEGNRQNVDVSVPLKVVDALFSTAHQDQVDVAAALRALAQSGDSLLVTVQSASQQVRVWVDSNASSN